MQFKHKSCDQQKKPIGQGQRGRCGMQKIITSTTINSKTVSSERGFRENSDEGNFRFSAQERGVTLTTRQLPW